MVRCGTRRYRRSTDLRKKLGWNFFKRLRRLSMIVFSRIFLERYYRNVEITLRIMIPISKGRYGAQLVGLFIPVLIESVYFNIYENIIFLNQLIPRFAQNLLRLHDGINKPDRGFFSRVNLMTHQRVFWVFI